MTFNNAIKHVGTLVICMFTIIVTTNLDIFISLN